MTIGELTIKSGFFKDKYFVLVEERKNFRRQVEFRNFENAMILSETLKHINYAQEKEKEE